jgi:hypothetical protein
MSSAPTQNSTPMHLRYCVMTAGIKCNETRHPQIVMRELGIAYQHATPQSICDQWWFWNCVDLPAGLPGYLSPLALNPHEQIGNGLSKEDADQIAAEAAK